MRLPRLSGKPLGDVRMTIAELLAENDRYRLDEPPLAETEVALAEQAFGIRLPPDYLEYLARGGLGDLRFRNRVLRPSEIQALAVEFIPRGLVPFASNGCGDHFCWNKEDLPTEVVCFWDHETRAKIDVAQEAATLAECLRAWRF